MHGTVGERVKVVFKNMASRAYSIHAHGVKTERAEIYQTKPGEERAAHRGGPGHRLTGFCSYVSLVN